MQVCWSKITLCLLFHRVRQMRECQSREIEKSIDPSASPGKRLVALPVSPAELDSCPSDTFILLQGFPTSASTENAWALELSPCILAKDPVSRLAVYPSGLWLCPAEGSVSQTHSGQDGGGTGSSSSRSSSTSGSPSSLTAAPWRCVIDPVRSHVFSETRALIQNPWLLARLSSPLQSLSLSPPLSVSVSPLSSLLSPHRGLVPPVPLCASQRGREERSVHSSTWARAAKNIHPDTYRGRES